MSTGRAAFSGPAHFIAYGLPTEIFVYFFTILTRAGHKGHKICTDICVDVLIRITGGKSSLLAWLCIVIQNTTRLLYLIFASIRNSYLICALKVKVSLNF